MNHLDIKQRIRHNLSEAHLELTDLRVQPDPFLGWRIAVISPGFQGKSTEERKKIVLTGLQDLTLQWLDLLTPQEQEWAGSLPIDSTLEDLPLWPEALARSNNPEGNHPENIVFPSDLDDDLELPIVATFYSLRGGVGRSTALAYTARILASRGRTVLCVDMDLEAPGLAALFGKESEIKEQQGLVFILQSLDQGEQPDIQNHLLRVSETDELYCIPAGLPNANYARVLNFIDPGAWYREDKNPLRELIQLLSQGLSFKPDVILLDARTGITPLNGPLLFDLADLAMIAFFPHPQAQMGTGELVRALLATKTRRTERNLTPEPRFIVSPIPSSKAPEIIERYQHRALEWIADWLSSLKSEQRPSRFEPIKESEITHFIPYREQITTSDYILSDKENWRDFEAIAEWLERFLPAASEQRSKSNLLTSHQKEQILEELEFSAGTAEYQKNFLETFVETDIINRALQHNIPLVLGRKGTGKTAIFRRLMETEQPNPIVVLSPTALKGNRSWIMTPENFKTIDEALTQTEKSWRDFWLLQTCLACFLSYSEEMPQPDQALSEVLESDFNSELSVVRSVCRLLQQSDIGLLARDWLYRFDRSPIAPRLMLFDGLDANFGNTEPDRARRRKAIEGLLSLITDLGDELQNLKFKLVLREDIYKKLRFDNKSHFYGRSVTLNWQEKEDFFKVVIKQALQSEGFRKMVQESMGTQGLFDINYYLSGPQVIEAWNLLVGERMRGGKSAFTRNWVWNRIADGSDNHSPRALLQLFSEAKKWEQKEQKQNPYEKAIIRPRALSASLEVVSKQALDALISEEFPDFVSEEFPELMPLIERLKNIGRSPFKSNEVSGLDEQLSLAVEVGLLSIYEGTEDDVERYKVPDLYLSGIGMTRKGQA
ncbi:P-loop ATPase, Sll1717 family [Laspinema olomoucense]|uniref:P-loop ATPase, Sll1717 family n=1 Tax=Laspinema olomoucense TaxID=3231600 RepID=UPI0021BB1277|nr:ParA family protein [Laspinema sp. D3d]MCT7974148.1 ParA family protein [Laspinema sp. D3d]